MAYENYYFSGQGKVYLGDRTADGRPDGLQFIGNVSELSISVELSKYEHKESYTGNRSTDLTIVQEIKAAVAMKVESLDKNNLAFALWGDSAVVAAATGVSETLTGVKTGFTYPLRHIGISNVVVTDGGTTTYELDKNYRVNNDGSIYIMTAAEQAAAGAANPIADGDNLTVTYDTSGYQRVDAITKNAPIKWMRFSGLNTARPTRDPVIVDIYKYQTDPLANLALINDEIAMLEISGYALADPLQTSGSKIFDWKYI